MNRDDFQQLADLRIAEAIALLTLPIPMPDAAYYLAGYAVECALKACIAKLVKEYDFPDKQLANEAFTHNFETLLRIARLKNERDTEIANNPAFAAKWIVVKDWSEQSRYARHDLQMAQDLIDAITNVSNGVLPWIKARW